MSLSSEQIKIITADIYYYNSSVNREEVFRVSTHPFPGYLPIISSVLPFSVSVSTSGISNGWGGLVLANINGELDYIVCDVDNNYVFNKRKVIINVYVGSTLNTTINGIVFDATADSDAYVSLRYTDPISQLDQPLVTINPDGSNDALTNNTLDKYKPYTLNQLYNDIRLVNTGIPKDNPRHSEKDSVLPFCIGDVFNYSPISLDFIYTDFADGYYLISPPKAELSVVVHQVKDGGVVLLKEGEELAGQQPNWKTVPSNPWLIKMITTPFNGITLDVLVGPSTVKGVVEELINNYPKYGSYVRDSSFSQDDNELGISGEAAVGYVGSCSDNIASVVNSVLSSVSMSLYYNNTTTAYNAYKNKLPPLSMDIVDPMYNYIQFYSRSRLRAGRFIDRDDSGNVGFEASTNNSIQQLQDVVTKRTYYDFPKDPAWSRNAVGNKGSSLRYYSNSAIQEDYCLDFWFFPDKTDPQLDSLASTGLEWMPLVEILTFKHMNAQSEYIQKMGSLIGNDVPTALPTDMSSDAVIGLKKTGGVMKLYSRKEMANNLWTTTDLIQDDWNYLALQYDHTTTTYSLYLNNTRIDTFQEILNKNFKTIHLAGAYSCTAVPTMLSVITDPAFATEDTPTGNFIYYIHKPLEYSGYLSEVRITNKLRYSGTTITLPDISFNAYTNKTVSSVITYADIVKSTLKLAKLNIPQKASVYLGYAKNWTSGGESAGMFTEFPTWKDALAKEFYEIYRSNESLVSIYRFTPATSISLESTLLVDSNDADREAVERLALYTKKTLELVMQVHPDLSSLNIGDIVIIKHHRYGLDPYRGRPAIVIGKSTDYMTNSHSLALLV